jgi:DUF971 family protein
MPQPSPPAPDPKSVQVNVTTGTGVDIDWTDGHKSHYSFQFLRDACPCALCDEERGKDGRQPGQGPHSKPGELPMFRTAAKPTQVEAVGKYAIRFTWNDGHLHGIYSWDFLREVCPCPECSARRAMRDQRPVESGKV